MSWTLPAVSGTVSDATWSAWRETMQSYQESINSTGLPKLSFWLVVALPKDSFSEKLEWHKDIPMLVPISGSGHLVGLAQNRAALDKMVEADDQNVHLTYKVKVQGQKAWRDLLEFLATHHMLEKE